MLSPASLPSYVEPGKSGLHPTAAARSVWLLLCPLNPCVYTRVSHYLISWYSKPSTWLGLPLCSRTREEEKGVARRRVAAVGDLYPDAPSTLQSSMFRNAAPDTESLMASPELRFRGPGGQRQTGQRITFVATEREEVACHLAGRCTPASTAGCLHLTSGAAPQPAARSRQGDPSQGPYPCITEVRKGKHTPYSCCMALCALCQRRGNNILGDVHLQRQQLLPVPWSPCLAPVSSQQGVRESRVDFTW